MSFDQAKGVLRLLRTSVGEKGSPARVGIEGGHLGGDRNRVDAQILLVDHSVLIDQNTHTA
jgi:hypothetical protein